VTQVRLDLIVLIFETGIGKSCIMKRLTTGDFKEDHDVTVGVEFTGYDIRIEDMVIRL
jgi:GTPase SAR1 family protein